MAVNKVIINTEHGEEVLIDLMGDTVTPETLVKGVTAHNARGELIVGALSPLNITDLTNTTWIIRNWSATAGYGIFNITGSATYPNVSGVETTTAFTELRIGYIYGTPADNKISTPSNDITANTYIMKFAPSPDVKNPDLIDWVCANGELQTASQEGEENQLDLLLNNTLTELNSNVTSVISYGCRGRTNLLTVNLPNATSVGSYAFYGCSKITSVNLPKATSITSSCFYQCTALTRADFGAAKSIGSSALAYCTALIQLILRRTDAICTLNSTSFSGVSNFKGYIYVPRDLIESYKVASNWSTYSSKFRAIEDYPDICG